MNTVKQHRNIIPGVNVMVTDTMVPLVSTHGAAVQPSTSTLLMTRLFEPGD